MNVTPTAVQELLDRAEEAWEQIKEQRRSK